MSASVKGLIVVIVIVSLAYFIPALSGYIWYLNKKSPRVVYAADVVTLLLPLVLYICLIAIEDRQGFLVPLAVFIIGSMTSLLFVSNIVFSAFPLNSWRVVTLIVLELAVWILFPKSILRMI
jgi:hypothetical protein